jgi:hypothetical protein
MVLSKACIRVASMTQIVMIVRIAGVMRSCSGIGIVVADMGVLNE